MIEQVRVPSIAEWPWCTLHTAVVAFAGVLPTFSAHFEVQGCPTFDCLEVAISFGAVVYDLDLWYSGLGSWLCLSL